MHIATNKVNDQLIDRLIRVHIAARVLGRSPRSITRWIGKGRLPATRLNRRSWGIRAVDLVALQEKMEEQCFNFNL
jgi:Helix-turn-helix domain